MVALKHFFQTMGVLGVCRVIFCLPICQGHHGFCGLVRGMGEVKSRERCRFKGKWQILVRFVFPCWIWHDMEGSRDMSSWIGGQSDYYLVAIGIFVIQERKFLTSSTQSLCTSALSKPDDTE